MRLVPFAIVVGLLALPSAAFAVEDLYKKYGIEPEGLEAKPTPMDKVYNIHEQYIERRIRDVVAKINREQAADKARRIAMEEALKRELAEDEDEEGEDGEKKADGDKKKVTILGDENDGKDEKKAADKAKKDDKTLTKREREAQEAKEKAEKEKAEKEAEAQKIPSMVIDFNRRHVNFDRNLRKLVYGAERSKQAPRYDIVSEVPMNLKGGRRNERLLGEYERNLNDVVQGFARLGVQGSRISVRTEASEAATSQKISIYQN